MNTNNTLRYEATRATRSGDFPVAGRDATRLAKQRAREGRLARALHASGGQRHAAPCASAISTAQLGGGMISLGANARCGECAEDLLSRLVAKAEARGLVPVQANVFCDPQTQASASRFDFPIAFLGHHDTPHDCVLSARIVALPGDVARESVRDEHGAICGARWETADARYLLLGALTAPDVRAPRDVQAAATWRLLKKRLEAAEFRLGDLVRTWFFNDHILDWYDDFNRVRNAFFTEHGIFGTLVPASTGVGACNAAGAALSLDALAVAPKSGDAQDALRVSAVTSPLQCAAYDYRSAFSRAVECALAGDDGGRHLLISGTASIEPGGETAHHDDLDAQIDLSLRVVEAILKSRDMDWSDVARAILYFPKIEWMSRWDARREALGIPALPGIFGHCDICRDDLLFEIELDAWKSETGCAL